MGGLKWIAFLHDARASHLECSQQLALLFLFLPPHVSHHLAEFVLVQHTVACKVNCRCSGNGQCAPDAFTNGCQATQRGTMACRGPRLGPTLSHVYEYRITFVRLLLCSLACLFVSLATVATGVLQLPATPHQEVHVWVPPQFKSA